MHYFGIRNRVTLLVLIATTRFPVLWHPYSALHSKWIISHLIPQEMVQQSKCPVRRSICLGKWCRLAMAASCQSKWPLNVVMKGESNQNSLFFVLFNAAKLGIFSTGDFMAVTGRTAAFSALVHLVWKRERPWSLIYAILDYIAFLRLKNLPMMWMDELSLHVKKNIFNWISVWYFVETCWDFTWFNLICYCKAIIINV